MPTYTLSVRKIITYDIKVKASDESEAEDLALTLDGEVTNDETLQVEFFDIEKIED